MSTRPDTDPTAPRGWITVGMFVVLLLGVLGMHGLAAHGIHGAGHHGGAPAAALPHSEPQAPAAALASVTHADATPTAGCMCDASTSTAANSSVGADDAGEPTSGRGAGMLELCLAVLTGIVLALLLTAAIIGARSWRLRAAFTQAVRALRARAPDPPSLHQLSLLRC